MRLRWLRWVASLLVVAALFAGVMRSAAGAGTLVVGTPTGTSGSGVSSLSWSHTVTSGSGRLLVVRVYNISSSITVSSVTYSGVALTQLTTANDRSSTTAARATVYYLTAPPVGTATVAVTMSASARVVANSIQFTGASQVAPFGTVATASGNSTAPSVTVASATGEIVLDAVTAEGNAGSTLTAGGGQTATSASTGTTAADAAGMGSVKAGAASTTMSWSYGTAAPWVSIGVPVKVAGLTVSGTVFEDVNYGGGAGRSLAGSGGAALGGATVELYNSAGSYVTATTTAGDGSYSFTDLAAGTYYVRVVNSLVPSQRTNHVNSLLGVMTYRTDASSGSPSAVTDQVGGVNPALVDPGAGSSGSAFNTGTFVFTAGLSGTAQNVTAVTVSNADIAGLDFGFNFDTVVNTNDSGAGSLRQAITNANTLGGDTTLAQGGRSAGIENLVFMLGNGSTATGNAATGGKLALNGGLRSSVNLFSGGAATITLASALPTVSATLVIDAQTQPGWTATPLLVVDGNALSSDGLTVGAAAGSSVLSGMIVRHFTGNGINIASGASAVTVTGNYVGRLNAAGTDAGASLANTASGIVVYGSGATVGGSSASLRNVVSGNNATGIVVLGNSAVIRGNYVGVNAGGTTALANGNYGIDVTPNVLTATVGGAGTGQGNVVSGNGNAGVIFEAGSTGTIKGNLLGTDATGTNAIAGNGAAVWIAAAGVVVGGTEANAGNVITGSNRAGVVIAGSTTNGVLVSSNSIYGNTGSGIDLNNDGITANDGAKTASQPNLLMDSPVFTSATLSGTTLTVAGYVGSAAGQSAFASARVEVFASDITTANGSGKTYLGALTANASGNFSGSLAGVVSPGVYFTATATDTSNNTSEFGPNFRLPGPYSIAGNVFEDANYGGGAGRNKASAAGSGLTGARVELYDNNGAYITSTTTAAGGGYSFTSLLAGSYGVRVVSSSVLSGRSGSSAGLVGVMTYRANASSGAAVDVSDNVGGTNPALVDPGNGSGGTVLGASTGVFSSGLSGTAHAYTPVTIVSANVTSVDFGFNFDTVVNTNDSGQGSLRQAITNANTLTGDNTLAQSGRAAGIENLVFMIANGSSAAGLRSGYNYFATSAGSYNVATITAASVFPAVSAPLVIDAQTQPGWTLEPRIEINGNGLTGTLFKFSGGSSTLRGFVINRLSFGGNSAVRLDTAGGNTVQGNWLGPNASGATATTAQRAAYQLELYSGANTVGGATASTRNVLSNALFNGIVVWSGAANVIQGNYIGTNAAGTAALPNPDSGIVFPSSSTATGTLIGGSNAGEGNVISGGTSGSATTGGISIQGTGATGSVIRGNKIGLNASGTATIASSGYGIYTLSANTTIGGTAAGAGNVITGYGLDGVTVVGSSATGVTIQGNSIYGNGGIGIDLADDGISANDGANTASQPNLLMDYPVFTAASLAGTNLIVTGYVGSAASQSTFAAARVEVFVSDGTHANGEGKTYLGYVTSDASGNFSGVIGGVSGLTAGTSKITGTATDGSGNTSEFAVNVTVTTGLTGTVFEDVNYGGGAGRNLAGSGGIGVSGATVELYTAAGVWSRSTSTSSSGSYVFTGLTAATSYFVRVASSTVPSQRSGTVGTLRGVPTYRTNGSSGSAVDVTDWVGGTNPALVDPGTGSAGAAFNTTTYVYSAVLSGTAQAVAPVTVAAGGIASVDFGFNFDTVVNTADSGQGSLRQAITNANTLVGDSTLAQSGRTAAIENIVFMISNGTAGAGLRVGYNYFTTSAGSYNVATIAAASALPTVTSALVIDAQTQPGWVANPIVDLNGAGAGSASAFSISGGGSTLRGLVIRNFSGSNGAIYLSGGNGNTVQGCWIGLTPAGTAAAGNAYGVYVSSAGNTLGGATSTRRNVIGGSAGAGVVIWSGASSNVVQGNYIGLNAAGTAAVGNAQDGIVIFGAGTVVGGVNAGEGNVIAGNNTGASTTMGGVETVNAGTAMIRGNLFGLTADGSATIASNGTAVIIGSGGSTVGGTASGAGNTVTGHTLRGVSVNGSTTTGVAIQGNSIYGNGTIGIDLGSDGATANHSTTTASQPNLLMDFPVFTSAALSGTTLTVTGYVGSAASQSAFAAARVEVFISDASNAAGQGKTYLGYLTTDASGNFSGSLTGITGVTPGNTKITATATDGNGNTSEFGTNATLGYTVSGTVFEDINYGGGAGRDRATALAAAGAAVSGATVELYDTTGSYVGNTTTAADGSYVFNALAASHYLVRVLPSTVRSTRSGSIAGLLPVQTWRYEASWKTPAAVPGEVGGARPDVADSAAAVALAWTACAVENGGSSNPCAFSGTRVVRFGTGSTWTYRVATDGVTCSTAVFGDPTPGSGKACQTLTPHLHSASSVTTVAGPVSTVDFGFNFDTVVNTNATGIGSLYQAITNANILAGDNALAQAGRTAGIESLVFMIGNGATGAGLRSANNFFTTSAGSYNVATITPASGGLPAVSAALVIDAQTQPGWTANPIIELNGTAGSGNGLNLSAAGSTLRGLVVNRFSSSGLLLGGGTATVQGCWVGLNAAGTAASGNGAAGLTIASASNVVGGSGATQRNVISGNGSGSGTYNAGILINSGTGNTVQGNYVGLNAAGTAAVANLPYGIDVSSTGNTFGGTTAGQGNVVSGNTLDGFIVRPGADGNTLRGNIVGGDAANSTALANGRIGITLQSNNNVVGDTVAGAGNISRGNTGPGIAITGSSTGNLISANSIYGNGSIGIDLAYNGITANDGAKTAGQPNLLMDTPVLTTATLFGTSLTVSGYVGSAAGQSTFAAAKVEVFIADSSGSRQGKTYIGTLTADASGNFSGTLSGVTGVTGVVIGSTSITATATDGSNNTSEFSAYLTPGYGLAGTVFEDVNYGGGSGRSLAVSGGSGIVGARVELYDSTGTFYGSTTTTAGGAYAFNGLSTGNWTVRVVGSTVLSTRSGSSASAVGVMTYRVDGSSGAPVDVTDYVGGTNPALVDAAAAAAGNKVNTTTAVFISGPSGTAQSLAPVNLTAAGITAIDFGFNFDTVVNTNDAGQGSLRQAITNANTLGGDASLAQSGRSAGIENLVFMLSNGTAGSGLRSALSYFSAGVATIAPASQMPTISAALVLDAQTQPGWTANPVVELNGTSAGTSDGMVVAAAGSTVRGLIINRYAKSGIWLTGGSSTVQGCWLGLNAAGTAASGNLGAGLSISSSSNTVGGTSASLRNVISGNGSGNATFNAGVLVLSGTGNTILGNYVGVNASGAAAVANLPYGIDLNAGSQTIGGTASGAGNLVSGNILDGLITRPGANGNLVQGNSFGANAAATGTLPNGRAGVDLASSNNVVGGTAAGAANTIRGNSLSGLYVWGNVNGNSISGNSIYGNGGVGIDLAYDGQTSNDGAKTAGQPNLLMDYPVFTGASLSGTALTVAGYVGSAAGQSLFAAARVEVFVSDASNSNGQGKTYLGYVTTDANGNFNGAVTVPGTVTLTAGSTKLTGTATDASNNTSEFGPNFTYGLTVAGSVFEDINYGGGAGRSLAASAGSGVAGARVELYDASGTYSSATTTASDGSYSFPSLAAGNWYVRVVGGTVASTRSGSVGTLAGVLTYRTNASSGSAVAVTDTVGGSNPALVDPGNGSGGTSFNTGTGVFSAGLAGTAQAYAAVTLGAANVSAVDFGFNFDTVTNTSDSGPGSLRQVLTNANTLGGDAALAQAGRTAAIENLVFMIGNGSSGAGLRSTVNFFSSGVATITPGSALPAVSTAMVIDAQTQPGWTANPVIELRGNAAGATAGLVLSGGSTTLRGLIVNRFAGGGVSITAGGSDTVQGNWIGLDATGAAAAANGSTGLSISSSGSGFQIGGTTATLRNVISGNTGFGFYAGAGSGLVMQGNYVGLNAAGTAAVGNSSRGIFLDSVVGATTLGGTAAGAGNVIAGNPDYAVWLAGGVTTVQGNFIGTNAAGTAAIANAYGIFAASGGHQIGGTVAGARNVISGNTSRGIWLNSDSNTVQGNTIGSNAAGTVALPNGTQGIYVKGNNNAVGGTAAGAGNLVSGNTGGGVRVFTGFSGNAIQGNAIYGNGALGIDLDGDGVSANDGAKTVGAANLLMDTPVYTSARATGSKLVVAGYVGSAAGQSVFAGARVEVYASDGDASGYGEGRTLLGALTADGSGNFGGTLTMPLAALPLGTKLTATATDGSGNTSEFGPNYAGLIVDFVVNSTLDEADNNLGDGLCGTASGVCTLRAAIAELNAWASLPGTPSITFALPGCSSYGAAACSIKPATALPSLTRAMLIDGTTQAGWNSGSYAPIVVLDGSTAPAGISGLVVSTSGATVRGLVVGNFAGNGITLAGSSNTVAGNSLGTDATGSAALSNGGAGVYVGGTGNAVGGATAADRNLIAANVGNGVVIGASGTTVQGNSIGTDAGGAASLGNGSNGVYVATTGVSGVSISGNQVANNGGSGVAVVGGGPSQVSIASNAFWSNGSLGIDLGNDGVTANTGSSNAGLPNNGINQPVITGAGVGAGSISLTVYGYIGTGTGQAAFAGARVDFYRAAVDPSGYGEGQISLGALTADANGRFSGVLAFASGLLVVGDSVTATATDAAGNTSEFGANWTTTTVAALTPGSFNAFETDTAAGALTGVIRSKVAGTAATLSVIALDSGGTGLHPGFSGTVSLSWLDARDDSGAASGSCRASWVDLGSAGSAVFSNASRVDTSVTPPASATRVMRLKISYTGAGGTVTACSSDAFAALPASLAWINASDADAATAGTLRVLDNTGAAGGVVHRAGRPFTVRAQALDALGAAMTGYDGTPALAVAGCLLPAGCSAGALAYTPTSALAGAYVNSSVSYAEVGALQLQLTDSHYADVDSADTAAGVRTLSAASLAVGRFVPDSYVLAFASSGVLATANAACLAAGQGATFLGQGFGWATAPQVTVTAKNAAGTTTALWTGTLMKLVPATFSGTLTVANAGSATLAASYGAITVADLGAGQARASISATDRFVLDVAAGTVQASSTPSWNWALALNDGTEAGVAGNPTLAASATQLGVGFDHGALFHSGRLALAPGFGDARSGVRLLVQLQRWSSAGWVTMTEDQGCVAVQPQNLGVDTPVGIFVGAGVCAAPMTATATTQGGHAWLTLPASPAAAPGRLTLRLAGAAAVGNSCTAGGATAALVPIAQPWLLGGSSGAGPQALATWGLPNRDAVLRRETW